MGQTLCLGTKTGEGPVSRSRSSSQRGAQARTTRRARSTAGPRAEGLRCAMSREGSQAVTPHVVSGTGEGVTRPMTAVIVTAAAAMIVVRAGECQPKAGDQTASGVRDSTTPCTLALVRPSILWLITYRNELINTAVPAEHAGPPDNSVTGVCGIPPQKPDAMWLSIWATGRGRRRPATRRLSSLSATCTPSQCCKCHPSTLSSQCW